MIYLIYQRQSLQEAAASYHIIASLGAGRHPSGHHFLQGKLEFISMDHLKDFASSLLKEWGGESCCLLSLDIYNQRIQECSEMTELRKSWERSGAIVNHPEFVSNRQSWLGRWFQ